MRSAIYGGSFDPPHVGHVLAAAYVLCIGVVDRVLVVPVFDHAHDKSLSDFTLRAQLCQAAFGADPRVEVCLIEEHLPRPSYTLRTILALRELYPDDDFRLIMGADVLAETEKWHRFDEVISLAPPLVLGRIGAQQDAAPPALLPDVSSTEVREWIRRDTAEDRRNLELFTPCAVRELIAREGLYR